MTRKNMEKKHAFTKKACAFAVVLVISGCQGAYKTKTGAPDPVLDMRAEHETPLKIDVIPTGGIIMKRTYDPNWEMPKRDVDVLRKEFASLQNELLAMTSGQDKVILEKFNQVEGRVSEMRREEMRQAAKDMELMALVKSKFDVIDKNIEFLKASEAQQTVQKDALLSVLDDKFNAVGGRLETFDKKSVLRNEEYKQEIRLALQEIASLKADKNILIRAIDKKFVGVEGMTSALSKTVQGLEYEQDVQKRMVTARQQAIQEAREVRLLEELEIRKQVEDARREQLVAVVRKSEEHKREAVTRDYEQEKQQAIIEAKVSGLKEKLKDLEEQEAYRLSEADEREKTRDANISKLLTGIQETYDLKLAGLEKERAELEVRVAKERAELEKRVDTKHAKLKTQIDESDTSAIKALEDQKKGLDEAVASLKAEQEKTVLEAEEYRHAVEERIFAMESKEVPMEVESIDQGSLAVGRIIESDAEVNSISMSPATGGGVIGGYAQEDWIELEDYQVVLHENNSQLDEIMRNLMSRAEPYVGPWQVRWKLKEENMDVVKERFSLDVETDFDAFASYISNYMKSYRGFGLTFNIFRTERILVITD